MISKARFMPLCSIQLKGEKMPPEQQGRNDLVEYPIQDNVRLKVYWRDDRAGYGPAASMYAYDQEILRLDCFGEAKETKGKGHCHINLRQTKARQWHYRPGSVRDHVEQAMHDLRHNLGFCLFTNTDERIQQTTIDPETLEPIAQQAEAKMLAFMHQLGLE
jgi:hypothetical protein